jgi:putative endonuclease
MDKKETGLLAEHSAAQYLKTKGYEVIDRNWRKPWGEIDIIAKNDNYLVFVEVKAGKESNTEFEPELRVDRKKIRKIARTAETYLTERGYSFEKEWQIDVVSVVFDGQFKVSKIRHFRNI